MQLVWPSIMHYRNNYTLYRNARYRENTIGSFKSAGKSGAHLVEFDVQLTSDMVPTIYHDFHVLLEVQNKMDQQKRAMIFPFHKLNYEELKDFKVSVSRIIRIEIENVQIRRLIWIHSMCIGSSILEWSIPFCNLKVKEYVFVAFPFFFFFSNVPFPRSLYFYRVKK